MGLVDEVHAPDRLDARVQEFAAVLAGRSALTQRATKEIVAALTGGRDAEPVGRRPVRETIASGELAEGVAAFGERASPRFPWGGIPPALTVLHCP